MVFNVKLKLLNKDIDELLSESEFDVDVDEYSFGNLKTLIKDVYTGSTRITNNDIGLYFHNKPLLDFYPLGHKSFYGLTEENGLVDVATIPNIVKQNDDTPLIELDLLINVDGFFRDYEPVFTDGLLRSEGHGLFSTILNTNYDKLVQEGIRARDPIESSSSSLNIHNEEVISSKESTPVSELKMKQKTHDVPYTKNKCQPPKIFFIDSKTKNRIRVLSGTLADDLVLVEIENYNNTNKPQRGYLPKSSFIHVSKFYLDFYPQYSTEFKEIEIDRATFNEAITFKMDVIFIKKSFLIDKGVMTDRELQESSKGTIQAEGHVHHMRPDTYEIEVQQFEDLRAIFDPRSPITESCLNFLSVVFKTIYLIMRHSVLATIVLFNLTNFIPAEYAMGLTVCNFIYTLLTDNDVRTIWAEYLKSYKMLDTEYNEIISMISKEEEIPCRSILQLSENQFVKDQISDYLRKSQDFELLDYLYGLVENDKYLSGINLKEVKEFIKNTKLPSRTVKCPYKTVDFEFSTLVAEPDLRDTVLDEFVDKFFMILKEKWDYMCANDIRITTTDDPEEMSRCMERIAKDLFKSNQKIYHAFQKPLLKLIVENVNFWKVNNFHLKPSVTARWRVDFEQPNNKDAIEAEVKRIDTDLNDMVHTIVAVLQKPKKFISLKNKVIIKDPLLDLDRRGQFRVLVDYETVFVFKDGRLALQEGVVPTSRQLGKIYERQMSESFLMTVITSPLQSALLVIRDIWELSRFISSFTFANREEWFFNVKTFLLDGDIVYRYLPVLHSKIAISYYIPCHFILFFLTLIPAYHEKLNNILSEREILLEQATKEVERYWEIHDEKLAVEQRKLEVERKERELLEKVHQREENDINDSVNEE